jgi:tetraacyldisaccharide 4'-kinase
MSLRSLLAPLTPLYRLGLALRERRLAIRRLRFPVISIGNLSTGGAGKTPMAIALAKALAARGFHVDVLSRGYGRSGAGAARVRPDGTAEEFGDEPLVIARRACVPVYVAAERYEAGLLAESEGAPAVHILDDGFQHRQLHRDIDILLLSARDLRDRLLPAGNLREALHAATRADVIAIPAAEPEVESDIRAWRWSGPVWRLGRRMEVPPVDAPALAFCGIARPEQFFAGLQAAGADLAATETFRDHHRYTQNDLDRLAAKAARCGASALLTTEKDAVRLAGLKLPLPVVTAALLTEIANEGAAMEWLASRLDAASG